MRHIAELINPENNKSTKVWYIHDTYREAERHVQEKNEKLNIKPNPKGLYWKITAINA